MLYKEIELYTPLLSILGEKKPYGVLRVSLQACGGGNKKNQDGKMVGSVKYRFVKCILHVVMTAYSFHLHNAFIPPL